MNVPPFLAAAKPLNIGKKQKSQFLFFRTLAIQDELSKFS
jgi:hypothetical protein